MLIDTTERNRKNYCFRRKQPRAKLKLFAADTTLNCSEQMKNYY